MGLHVMTATIRTKVARAAPRVPRTVRYCARRFGRDERGAAVIWFAVFVLISIMGGAIVIDYGDVVVERRDHQKSADSIVLAGIQELPEDSLLADQFARQWGLRNGISASDIVNLYVDNSCWNDHPADDPAKIDSVSVDVSRPARLFLLSELGINFDVGAHAKACVGSLRETEGLRPWSISILNSPCFQHTGGDADDPYNYEPLYGEECTIRLESPSSQVGSIRLGDEEGDPCDESGGGASKYKENIIEGSGATCEIGEVIDTEPGLQVGPTFDALLALLSGEGACDDAWGNSNGYDELLEAFSTNDPTPGPDTLYTPLDCGWDEDPGTPDTPRFVSLVLIDEFDSPTGFGSEPIIAFAGFFIDRCEVIEGDGTFTSYPQCDVPPGDRSNVQIVGTFIQHLKLGGAGGPLDPFGTRIYALVE
jgi:hypothetical protein